MKHTKSQEIIYDTQFIQEISLKIKKSRSYQNLFSEPIKTQKRETRNFTRKSKSELFGYRNRKGILQQKNEKLITEQPYCEKLDKNEKQNDVYLDSCVVGVNFGYQNSESDALLELGISYTKLDPDLKIQQKIISENIEKNTTKNAEIQIKNKISEELNEKIMIPLEKNSEHSHSAKSTLEKLVQNTNVKEIENLEEQYSIDLPIKITDIINPKENQVKQLCENSVQTSEISSNNDNLAEALISNKNEEENQENDENYSENFDDEKPKIIDKIARRQALKLLNTIILGLGELNLDCNKLNKIQNLEKPNENSVSQKTEIKKDEQDSQNLQKISSHPKILKNPIQKSETVDIKNTDKTLLKIETSNLDPLKSKTEVNENKKIGESPIKLRDLTKYKVRILKLGRETKNTFFHDGVWTSREHVETPEIDPQNLILGVNTIEYLNSMKRSMSQKNIRILRNQGNFPRNKTIIPTDNKKLNVDLSDEKEIPIKTPGNQSKNDQISSNALLQIPQNSSKNAILPPLNNDKNNKNSTATIKNSGPTQVQSNSPGIVVLPEIQEHPKKNRKNLKLNPIRQSKTGTKNSISVSPVKKLIKNAYRSMPRSIRQLSIKPQKNLAFEMNSRLLSQIKCEKCREKLQKSAERDQIKIHKRTYSKKYVNFN